MLLHTCILAACVIVILGYPWFRDRIPNGFDVPNPCDIGTWWYKVGHNFNNNDAFTAYKSRNPFGQDFEEANFGWTTDLCEKDSDGDGVTNGEELGDPDCQWYEGDIKSSPGSPSGHPGLKCDHGGDDDASTCATACV